ncbi:hypothetical protein KPH14_010321 [Odynerus spinipes]|uniref:Uncharacterized protein n=1 Tax=Odynerus spinipes TaxID=1348599 RepID=A0AAD9VSS6_9HYME|nr:hypothetical protein KPH14_010321 [Odynerus spinipes]
MIILWQTLIIMNVNAKKPRVRMEIDMSSSKLQTVINEEPVQNNFKNGLLKKGQFFRDLFSAHLSEHEIEFGHVCENPNEWEQRFERKDMGRNSYQGKIKWGNKNGDYGEHYWDLNH